ncbi:cytochrome P450 [Deinococcus fonticola]|uniref:cytochrome P450 n=1 Tax=Deinococcus fonticola TaxID=2528713 RepID=UPI001F1052F7|nr:cytochrome P450 [Deinococcus fonticola]
MIVIPRTPPTVRGLPIVGNMLDLMATPGMRAFLTRAYQQHGPVYQVRALNTVMTVLAGPEANTFVMK